VAHAYLFAGPRGTGKTTTARLLAKAVNCLDEDLAKRPCDQCEYCLAVNQGRFLDLIEIDAASNTSVEDVRDLRDKINFLPNQGRFKVYIIDEVHMLSTAAFNALLKTLEEPPPHAIFILATTEIHKIPATVLSRCQRHEFRRIPVNEIVVHLREIAKEEGLRVDDEALSIVARQATGSLRDAISLLDQLASTDQAITLELAQTVLGTAANQAVVEIVNALLDDDTKTGLDRLHSALDAGSDPRQFARQIVDYLRNLLLIRMGSADQVDATSEMRAQMAQQAQRLETSELLRWIRAFNQSASESRSTWQPSLPLELAFIEAISPEEIAEVEKPTRKRSGADPAKKQHLPKPATVANDESETSTAEVGTEEDLQSDAQLKSISANWRQILTQVNRQSPNTAALLRSGRLLGMKNGVVYFGLSEVLKSKMEKDENVAVIEQALKQTLQADVQFRCVVSGGKSGSLPPDVDGEGMVASALRDLGGEIVDIQ
jgi:DNA polymerase III subunit gamma/tau